MRRHPRLSFRRFRLPPAGWLAVVFAALLASRLLLQPQQPEPSNSPGPFLVERVVDGDTLVLADGRRVRLIGVDTPETKHPTQPVEPLGPEATHFTRRHVEGRYVTLRFDRERRDRYGRVLAFVYLDDWFLNEQLIAAGFSRAETQYPYSQTMKRRFQQAEERARRANAGLWALQK